MPKVHAVDDMNESELRAEFVSLLADGVIRYMQSEQFAIDHADRDFDTACLNRRENGDWSFFYSSLRPPVSSLFPDHLRSNLGIDDAPRPDPLGTSCHQTS